MLTIQNFPVELLTQIFRSNWLDSDFSVTLDSTRGLVTQIKEISSTCSTWRAIVCSDPVFWSSFDLNLSCMTSVEQAILLSLFLSRSGTAAGLRLNIIFSSPQYSTSSGLEGAQLAVLDLLLDQSSRWRDVRLDIAPEVFAHVVSRLTLRPKPTSGYFPNLECLDTQDQESTADDYEEPGSNDSLFRIFHRCPALKRLCAHDAWAGDPIDYSHLTSLDLISYRGKSLSSLLSRCPHLRQFSIAYCIIPDIEHEEIGPWSKINPFYHLNLVALSLPIYHQFGCEIWEGVRFPSLHTLKIDQVEQSGNEIPELLAMLRKSGCSLRTLELGDMSSNVFRELLSNAPYLQSLTLTPHYTSNLHSHPMKFEPLFGKDSRVPVPMLSYLTVQFRNANFTTI
ncbi:hypothetical protein F5876DRAFT_66311 [Lentinula aff. lateritia]|uniref:Uncharacterized protein n=1 Tax=Lentinula aff. lateritia TaxID=2804960 RepID=A0ACC1TXY2_9AGAR|nr:hypothetical protein F5876DRAFT_66311 [Lentinula aff. lateritia]